MITGVFKKPTISPSATSPQLSAGTQEYFLRTAPNDAQQAIAMAMLVDNYGWKQVCTLSFPDVYGNAGAQQFGLAAGARGVRVALTVSVDDPGFHLRDFTEEDDPVKYRELVDGAKRDMQLLKDKGDDCRIIILFTNGELDLIIAAAGELGIVGEGYQWVASDATLNQFTASWMRPEWTEFARGIIGTSPSSGEGEIYDLVLDRWATRTDDSSNSIENIYYDDGNGVPSTAASLYTWDAVYAYAYAFQDIIDNGGDVNDGELLLAKLKNSTFIGATGRVSWNDDNNREGAIFEVYNAVVNADGTSELVHFGTVSGVPPVLDLFSDKQVIFMGGGTEPLDLSAKLLTMSSGFFIAVDIVIGLVMFFCIIVALILFWKRHVTVVRASSPFFNNLILFGAIIGLSSAIAYSIEPGLDQVDTVAGACLARPWLVTIGFSLVFGCLFAKTWRVHKIFNDQSASTSVLGARQLLVPVCIMLVYDIVVLAMWSADGIYARRSSEFRESDSGPLRYAIVCQSGSTVLYLLILYVPKILLIGFGMYVSFRTRRIKMKDFNEAKYIGAALYNVAVVLIILVPIIWFLSSRHENIAVAYLLTCVAILWTFFGVVALLYGPKLFVVFVSKESSMGESGGNNIQARRSRQMSTPVAAPRQTNSLPAPTSRASRSASIGNGMSRGTGRATAAGTGRPGAPAPGGSKLKDDDASASVADDDVALKANDTVAKANAKAEAQKKAEEEDARKANAAAEKKAKDEAEKKARDAQADKAPTLTPKSSVNARGTVVTRHEAGDEDDLSDEAISSDEIFVAV